MSVSGLDDPDRAAHAWARYKRVLRWMALAAVLTAAAGLTYLRIVLGTLPLHMAIAATLGLFFSVLLGAALMGLVFLSSGTGHDEAIDEAVKGDDT